MKRICLPVYRQNATSPAHPFSIESVIFPSAEEFPCPKCSPLVEQERVFAIEEISTIAMHYSHDSAIQQRVRVETARNILERLVQDDYFTFKEKRDPRNGNLQISAELEVVHPRQRQSMASRLVEQNYKFAVEVVEEATHRISNWNVIYTQNGIIEKHRAADCLRDALSLVADRHTKAAKAGGG